MVHNSRAQNALVCRYRTHQLMVAPLLMVARVVVGFGCVWVGPCNTVSVEVCIVAMVHICLCAACLEWLVQGLEKLLGMTQSRTLAREGLNGCWDICFHFL